jgi:hypothetical protein
MGLPSKGGDMSLVLLWVSLQIGNLGSVPVHIPYHPIGQELGGRAHY